MKKSKDWIDYWDSDSFFDHFDWKDFDEFFLTATEAIMNYNSEDVVLDIGCGAGHLEALLKDKVKEIHGVDTSERYIHECREKFRNECNVFFHKLEREDYTDFSFLKKKFSKIICLSVIQYYRNIDDVEMLIKKVERVASPGAQFIIADIITRTSLASDIRDYIKGAARRKSLIRSFFWMISNRKSAYYEFYFSKGLLVLSFEKIHELIDKLNLNAEILDTQLTACENRKHLLIKF